MPASDFMYIRYSCYIVLFIAGAGKEVL